MRVRLVAACIGDLLRFGNVEVELEQITSLFDADAGVRLAEPPIPSLFDTRTGRYALRNPEDEPTLSNPKRNPDTGELEDVEGKSGEDASEGASADQDGEGTETLGDKGP